MGRMKIKYVEQKGSCYFYSTLSLKSYPSLLSSAHLFLPPKPLKHGNDYNSTKNPTGRGGGRDKQKKRRLSVPMGSSVPLFPSTSATGPSTSTPLLIRAPLSYEDSTDVTDGGSIGATDSDIESFVSGDEHELDSMSVRNEYLGFNNESVSMAFTPKARISVDDEDDDEEDYGDLEEVIDEGDFSDSVMVPPIGEAEGVDDAKDGILMGNVPSLDEEMLVEEEKPQLVHQNGGFDDMLKYASEGTDDGNGLDDVDGKSDDVRKEDEGFYQGSSYPFEADENSDVESSDLTAEQNLEVGSSHELVNHQIDEAMVDEDGNLDIASSSVDSGITQEPKLDGLATTDGFDGIITLKLENESEQIPVGIGTNSTAVLEAQISSDMETQSLALINDDYNELRNEREVKLRQYGALQDTDVEGKMRDLIKAAEEKREESHSESDDKKKDDTVCEALLKLDREKGRPLVDPVQTSAGQENSKEEGARDEQKLMDFSESVEYGNNEEPQPECHYVKIGSIVDEEPPAKLGSQDEKRPNEVVLTSTIPGERSDEEENIKLEQTSTEVVLNSKEVVSNSHAVIDGWRSMADAELPISFCEDCEDLQNSTEVTSDKSEKINTSDNYDDEEDSVSSIISEEPALVSIFEGSKSFSGFIKDPDDGFWFKSSDAGSSQGISDQIDRDTVRESDEEIVPDEADNVEKLFDLDFLKARSSISPDDPGTLTTSDSTRFFRSNLSDHPNPAVVEHDNNNLNEDDSRLQEKVEKVCLKFLHLVHRLGYSSEENIAIGHVLHMLDLVGGSNLGRRRGHFFSKKSVKEKELPLEMDRENLEFSCNILVIGKTGVGKSAVINSIFHEQMTHTSAFKPATTNVKVVFGVIDGVKIQIMDTPGFSPSLMDYGSNRKILLSIRKHMKKFSPDCVLYVDRLDTSSGNSNDLPLFRSISDVLGLSIWDNAVVALTHAGCPPPDGSNGTPLPYDVFVQKRYNVIRDCIRKQVGCATPIPMALVENHPSCKTNGDEKFLPDGVHWRQRLLLLCYSSKVIAEVKSMLEVKKPSQRKIFGLCVQSRPLLYLSSLLPSRSDTHLTADRSIHNSDTYLNLMDFSDSEKEEDGDDRLDCFESLRKLQIAKLSKEQQEACFEGCDYQVKILQKKQMDKELGRVKEVKNSTGLKIEDQVAIRRKVNLEANLGTCCSQIDLECGLNVDVDKDYHVGHDTSNLGICLLRWRNDLVVMSNLQCQFSVGQKSNMGVHLVLNNKRTGQITVKTSTSSNLQVPLLGLLPMFISIFRIIWPGESSLG